MASPVGVATNAQGQLVWIDAQGHELESDGQGGWQIKQGASQPTPLAPTAPTTNSNPQPVTPPTATPTSAPATDTTPSAPSTDNTVDTSSIESAIDSGGMQNSAAIIAAFQPAVKGAQDQYNKAWQAMQAADQALQAAQTARTNDITVSTADAQRNVDNARTQLQNAADKLATVQTAQASALERFEASRWATPEEKARAQALADDANAQADLRRTQAAVATATAPADIAKATADAAEAQANAQLTGAKVQVATATTQAQIDAANIAVQQAQQNVEATKIANRKGTAEATTAEAQASVSPQLAQTSVDQAQANVNKTLTEIADLQRQLRQAPTDAQAQEAIQTQFSQKQVELQTAQQQLDQAKRLMPIAVEQGQANVAATQASTANLQQQIAQKAQGPLYGVTDQIAKYKQMIANGQMTPQDADAAISDYVTRQLTGAGSFERATATNAFNQGNYQTQVGFNQNMINQGSGMVNNMLGDAARVLQTVAPGHGTEFGNYVGSLMNFWNNLGQQYAAPPAPQNAVSSAPVVHINIGSGPPTSGGDTSSAPSIPAGGLGMPPAAPAAPAQPVAVGGAPALPDAVRPATPQDVMANWQNEIQSGVGQAAASAGLGAMAGAGG